MRKLICILLFLFSNNLLANSIKPFWTEKSSYIEDRYLYVVGVATNSVSIEKGRNLAFENGKQEIMNFSQLSKIDGVVVETQMTYEEEAGGGKYNIYRLMFVEYDKLSSLISKKIKNTKINYEKYQKKQEQEIEIKKVALSKIKKNTDELARLDVKYNAITNNIESLSEKALRYVKVNMTKDEVEKLLGRPRTMSGSVSSGLSYNYGKYWIVFDRQTNMANCVSTIYSCVSSYAPHICNDDKSVCQNKYGAISYYNKMFE